MRSIFTLCLALFPATVWAQSFSESAPATDSASSMFNRESVTVFMDSVISTFIQREIPGVVAVVVQDGEVLFSKGYGSRDLATGDPVDANTTLFYTGSVTKMFTATAVMQLVEQGKLDLDTDINDYIEAFQIPGTFAPPLTLRHLLTHTAGFDDKNIGYVAKTEEEAQTLGDYLQSELPPRIMPPGQISSYSNHGFGLAGYLVERASGLAYADYIEQQIFQPLGMLGSSAHVPPGEGLSAKMAVGYDMDYRTGNLNAVPLGYRNLPPAGSLSITGADMAKFMIARLRDGRLGDSQIFGKESADLLDETHFNHDPRLPGVGFGVFENHRGRVRTLEHAGGFIGFSTYLALVPKSQLGVYVAVNKTSGGSSQIATALLDRLLPTQDSQVTTTVNTQYRPEDINGTYHWSRYSRSTIEKISIWDSPVFVTLTAKDELTLKPAQGSPSIWHAVEPDLFRHEDREEFLTFREENGRITHLLYSQGGVIPVGLEKIPWYDDVVYNRPVAMALIVLSLITCLVWPLAVLTRAAVRRIRKTDAPSAHHRLASFVAGVTGLLNLVFFIGLDTWVGNSVYRVQLVYGLNTEMFVLLWLPLVCLPLTLLVSWWAVQAWRESRWTLFGRTYYSIVAMSSVVTMVFLYHWNLLGFVY